MNGRREKVRLLGIDAPEITYGRLRSSLDRLVEQTLEPERGELEAAIAVIRRQAESAEDGTRRAAWPQKAMRAARARDARGILQRPIQTFQAPVPSLFLPGGLPAPAAPRNQS